MPNEPPLTEKVPETELEDLVGCSGYIGPPKTLEEMDEGIASRLRDRLSPSEERELTEAMEEIHRGEYVDGDDLLKELRARSFGRS
jgi:hypothetical protein